MFCCSASFLIKTQNKDLHCRLDFTSCVAMAVDIPLLLPIDEFLVKRHDMWKHALRFIIRMTTGVVYSIAMHVLLITAYALLTFQIFYTKDFDLVLSFDATSLLSFIAYLLFGLFEIVGRTFLNDQVLFTFFGHVGHMVGLGSMFLLAYNKYLAALENDYKEVGADGGDDEDDEGCVQWTAQAETQEKCLTVSPLTYNRTRQDSITT
ncbi:hypothetical protein YC2023_035973 [Brassica napus]